MKELLSTWKSIAFIVGVLMENCSTVSLKFKKERRKEMKRIDSNCGNEGSIDRAISLKRKNLRIQLEMD